MGFRALLEKGKKCSPGGPPPARIHSPQVDAKRKTTDGPGEESPGSENIQPSPPPAAAAAAAPRLKSKRNGRTARSGKPTGGGGGGGGEFGVTGLRGIELGVEVPVGMELEVREDATDAGDELEDDEEEKKVDIMRE